MNRLMELAQYILDLDRGATPQAVQSTMSGFSFFEGVSQGRTANGSIIVKMPTGVAIAAPVDDAEYQNGTPVMVAQLASGKIVVLGEIH